MSVIGFAACHSASASLSVRSSLSRRDDDVRPCQWKITSIAASRLEPFDFAQPIEMAAVCAATEAVIVIAINVQAGRVVFVERARDLAVDRLLADQVRQRNAREPLVQCLEFRFLFLRNHRRSGRDRYWRSVTVDLARRCGGDRRLFGFVPGAAPSTCAWRRPNCGRTSDRPGSALRARRLRSRAGQHAPPAPATTPSSRGNRASADSGTMPSRQHARIHSLVCRAADPWISAFIALCVSARRSAWRRYQG